MINTQEALLAFVSRLMEANGWQKEWVNISTGGFILVRFRKETTAFTMSLEDMERDGKPLPDVSDIYVD